MKNSDLHDPQSDPEHAQAVLAELGTVADWLRYAVSRFNRAQIFCGHGVDNTVDEALWLVLGSLQLPLDQPELFVHARLLQAERQALLEAIERRVLDRVPTAYILGEAWLQGLRFSVDERVIVPRSFFAQALVDELDGWLPDAAQISHALDMCTGSGCLAILLAHVLPQAQISAADLSLDALDVALQNVCDHGLEDRIELVHSDLFAAFAGRRFGLILSNPPYVTEDSMRVLPAEYLHEPRMALAAGDDGLDIVRQLIERSAAYLEEDGLLAVEVGHNRALVEAAFPALPFNWLATADHDQAIFILRREQLPAARS